MVDGTFCLTVFSATCFLRGGRLIEGERLFDEGCLIEEERLFEEGRLFRNSHSIGALNRRGR